MVWCHPPGSVAFKSNPRANQDVAFRAIAFWCSSVVEIVGITNECNSTLEARAETMLKKVLVVFFALVFLIFLVKAFNTRENESPSTTSIESSGPASIPAENVNAAVQTPVPVLTVSAPKLYLDYHANEVAADNVYKGNDLHP
jgi:hypothetical protein